MFHYFKNWGSIKNLNLTNRQGFCYVNFSFLYVTIERFLEVEHTIKDVKLRVEKKTVITRDTRIEENNNIIQTDPMYVNFLMYIFINK